MRSDFPVLIVYQRFESLKTIGKCHLIRWLSDRIAVRSGCRSIGLMVMARHVLRQQ
ncbi:hypothetical protein HanRHA438_Chr08g0341741 [Helianthus annuus]|nr:hypothetical protein HanRHA438_Chr08g0341741 [Helianthus annuus]